MRSLSAFLPCSITATTAAGASPFILLFFLLAGSCASGASFSTDLAERIERTVTETRTFTLDGDNPFSYGLTTSITFLLDDESDKAFVIDSSATDVPTIPPISRTEVSMERVFIQGNFPDPGEVKDIEVVTITTVTVGPFPDFLIRHADIGQVGYDIREDTNGFFFDYRIRWSTPQRLVGTITTSTSIDGETPTIRAQDSIPSDRLDIRGGASARIRIAPDLSLSVSEGSFFSDLFAGGLSIHFAAVPEPYLSPQMLLAIVWCLRSLHRSRASHRRTT